MSDAEFDNAVAQATRILRASRAPVVAGLRADVGGIVAAFQLARKLGAAIDHAGAEWALREQAVLQDIGLMLASPGEAWRRADTLLLVGDRPLEEWPELATFRIAPRPKDGSADGGSREIVALTSRALDPQIARVSAKLECDTSALPGLLGALRARINGRPLASGFHRAEAVQRAAEILKAAAFGVALWSPQEIDALTIEMLTGLIKDLNAATRWSGLPVSSDASLTAAAMASGWMAGLPLRTSFARDRPAHDPWAYDAQRMVHSGEADVVVWLSAFDDPLPDWLAEIPAIVLAGPTGATAAATVALRVGLPGRDHDGVLYDRATGTLVESRTSSPSSVPSAAETLRRIGVGLDAP